MSSFPDYPKTESKTRAPSIGVLCRPKSHVQTTPGANAFAVAAHGLQDLEAQKRAPKQSSVLSAKSHPSSMDRHTAETRESNATTFTRIMELARTSSPSKSGLPSATTSRHTKSSCKSGQSHRSQGSTGSTYAIQEAYEQGKGAPSHSNELEDTQALSWEYVTADSRSSVRATYEDRLDEKSVKVMGQAKQTNHPGLSPAILAGRYTDVKLLSDKAPEPVKSPRKKIFGMNIPTNMTLGFGKAPRIQPAPENIPVKAAEALGITSRPSRRDAPSQPWRPPPRKLGNPSTAMPSQSSFTKAEMDPPVQWSDQKTQHGSLPARHLRPKPQSATRTAVASSPALERRQKPLFPAEPAPLGADLPPNDGPPPPPPKKDTPKEKPQRLAPTVLHGGLGSPSSMARPSTAPPNGAQSATKMRPLAAEEYAKLVEGQRVLSASAHVESVGAELEGDTMHPGFGGQGVSPGEYPAWWAAERQLQCAQVDLTVTPLRPAFYSPSLFSPRLFGSGRPSQNTDRDRLLFAVPALPKPASQSRNSIDVIFQGAASEIDPASTTAKMVNTAAQKTTRDSPKNSEPTLARVMQELQLHDDKNAPSTASFSQVIQPDQASSRLTDMLKGISPGKPSREQSTFFASAQPSPLFHATAQAQPGAPSTLNGTGLSPSWNGGCTTSSTPFAFHMAPLHEHIDMLGKIVWDRIEGAKREARESAKHLKENQHETTSLMDQRFDDIKLELGAVVSTAEHASDQNTDINAKLDKLQDHIKKELVDRLIAQSKKTADLESNIKALQNTVKELQKFIESSAMNLQHMPAGDNPFAPQLPAHRSQPSLTGYFGTPDDSGRDSHMQRMYPISGSRNDARFAYSHYGAGNNGNAQSWYNRPGTSSRDSSKVDENTPFNSNPYHQHNALQTRSGNMGQGYHGGYGGGGGYYTQNGSTNENANSYNYNQGAAK